MAEEPPLGRLRRLLEIIHERADYALKEIARFEEVKSMRWRCIKCGYQKTFTRAVPQEIAVPCPHPFRGSNIETVPAPNPWLTSFPFVDHFFSQKITKTAKTWKQRGARAPEKSRSDDYKSVSEIRMNSSDLCPAIKFQ